MGSVKKRETSGEDSEDNQQNKEEAWQHLAEGLDSSEYQLMEPLSTVDPTIALKRLEDIATSICRLMGEFRRGIEEVKDNINRQTEKFQRDKDAAVLAARVEAQVAALQPDGTTDSTLQPSLDGEHQKKVMFRIL